MKQRFKMFVYALSFVVILDTIFAIFLFVSPQK